MTTINIVKLLRDRRNKKRQAIADREARAIFNAMLTLAHLQSPTGPDQW